MCIRDRYNIVLYYTPYMVPTTNVLTYAKRSDKAARTHILYAVYERDGTWRRMQRFLDHKSVVWRNLNNTQTDYDIKMY